MFFVSQLAKRCSNMLSNLEVEIARSFDSLGQRLKKQQSHSDRHRPRRIMKGVQPKRSAKSMAGARSNIAQSNVAAAAVSQGYFWRSHSALDSAAARAAPMALAVVIIAPPLFLPHVVWLSYVAASGKAILGLLEVYKFSEKQMVILRRACVRMRSNRRHHG